MRSPIPSNYHEGSKATELYTSRTIIRTWQRHDDELADEWPPYNDPFDPLWNLPRSFSFGQESWESFLDFGSSRRSWAVEDRYGRLIGRISLREIDEQRSQARLGITFGSPYVGQGLGTESLITFLRYYFTELRFRKMVLDVAAPNQRAVRCYEHLGFIYVSSDWREASATFDRRVLEYPRYYHLNQFFERRARGLWVEFFEMCLKYEDWLACR